MNKGMLSRLEVALLSAFHDAYSSRGFPKPEEIQVLGRRNTGAGRYVKLASARRIAMPDSTLDLGGKFIEMEGVPNGMMAVISIRSGLLDELEIAVYGEEPWDGVERKWAIR